MISGPTLLAGVALLLAAGGAVAGAGAGAHYHGTARDGLDVHVDLHWGAPLSREGTRQRTRVAVALSRGARSLPGVGDCAYEYDEADRRIAIIRCATGGTSPLSGVVWERTRDTDADDPEAPMVCVARCSRRVPARLTLDAHPDNH